MSRKCAAAIVLLAILNTACAHHRQDSAYFHQLARQNRARITEVRLGDSQSTVREMLGDPQSRDAVRTVRGDEENWRYVIDYHRSIFSEITFVEGKVVAIRETDSLHHD